MSNQTFNTNTTTGKVRLSYANLFKPRAMQPGQEEKYSVTLLIPKSDVGTKQRIDAAIEEAKRKGAGDKWGGVVPPVVSTPIHDGDGVRPSDGMPFGTECKGHWVMTVSSSVDYPPEVVDQNLNPIINQSEIYSGCYARVNVNFYPYYFSGKKGIGVGLGPVQKLEDGEPLGGGAPSADSVFGAVGQGAPAINPVTGMPM
ncbi:MAG: DUF2815 family protein [Tissierellia bacterium]|nr:DUF2815 family protein [Tissierellia bacterium]